MALSEIKLANKKARREAKRRKNHARYIAQKEHTKVRNKRMRKMMIEGRREHLKRQREATNYVADLAEEINGGQQEKNTA